METIQVLQRLDSETKAEVYLVGGFVRDLLRNENNMDLDIVVRGLSIRNVKKFLSRHGKVKEVKLSKTNDNFDVNIILFKAFSDKIEAQISLPKRGKKQIQDSRNTLRQDVRFRDFKLNTMYLPVNYTTKEDVIDLVGGKSDIKNCMITSNGSANERMKESPIRMLRAISLAARTNFTIDDEIIEAIKVNAQLIEKVPAEAQREEFNKILMCSKPSKYIRLLNKTGLLVYIAPELYECVGVTQDKRYHKYDVFTHLIYTCDNCEHDVVLRLSGLLHDIGKSVARKEIKDPEHGVRITFHKHEMISVKMARVFLRRLKYDTNTTKAVLALIRLHMYHFTRDWTDAAVRKFIKRADIGEEYMEEDKIGYFPLFKLRAAERMGNGLKTIAVTDRQRDFEKRIVSIFKESHVLNLTDLDINGNILMETFNIKPGEEVGNILNHLLNKVLENPKLNERLPLLKLATEFIYNKK